MSAQRSITLLHISDPQFGPKHRFDGTAPGSLFARLREDFEDMRERHGLVPDLILVTGDLVETGKPSEFKQFKAFAEATVEHFGLPRRRLVMIPGNHDINRAAAEAYFKQCEADERSPKQPYWPKLGHYAAMFAEFYATEPDISFTESAPYSLFEYPELGVVVAGLNSTLAESHRTEDHYGFLGEPQLRHFAGKLRLAADQGLLRIAAVHHHPIHPEGDGAKQDRRDLKRFLGPYLNLIVHGHIHEDELHWLDNTTPILGVGSAGVKAPQRPEEVPNQYQWIRVTADRLEYGSRAYVPDQKRWVDDLRPDRTGERWWRRKSVAFERVATLTSSAPAATGGDGLARAVASHRAALSRQLRERPLLVDLATYGEDGDIAHRLELLTIFIPQRTMQEIPRSDRPGELRDLRRREPEEAEFVTETAGPPGLIDEVVTSAAHPWTLVLGTPGAGKTTLTMWLALKLCADGEGLPGLSADLVPVRVELRLYVERWSGARKHGRSYDFFDYLDDVHREESRALRADALRELAANGRLLWLFDGLDEVANKEHRAAIANMIIGVRETHGGRGVITGRIVGCRHLQSRFHAADIHCFTLLDLSDEQIEQFIQRWHVLAFPQARELGARREQRLRQALAANSAVRDLCRNPLLLTLVALLNRGDELPRRRHKLLERASELMLSQWETNKELPPGHAVQFDPADKRRYLAELAWHMLTELPEGPGNVIEGEALERFTVGFCERRFQASPQSAAANARALIQHLRERNYVLGLLGGTQFGFLHKAFFEYFAAEEAVHRFRSQQWRIGDLKRVFTEHWRDDSWVEVLILICGLLQEDRSEPVIAVLQAVLASPPLTRRDELRNSLVFAVRCLSEVRRLDSGPALALALALNSHIRAVLQFSNTLLNRAFLTEDHREDKLSMAFRAVAGVWPGVEQTLTEIAVDESYGAASGSTLQVFLSALEGDTRISWYLRLLEGHRLSSQALHSAASAGLWSQADSERLWHQLRHQPCLSPTVTLATFHLLFETHATAIHAAELIELAPLAMRDQLRVLQSQLSTRKTSRWVRHAQLAALAMSGLIIEPAAHRPDLALWPIIPWLDKPTTREIEHLKSTLGADFERPEIAFGLALRLRNETYLRKALAAYDSNPRDMLQRLEFTFTGWPRAFDITLEWLRHLPDRDEGHRLTGLLEALWAPGKDVGTADAEQALQFSVREDGSPDWFILSEVESSIDHLEANVMLRCVDVALAVHTQQPLAVGLSMLSSRVERYGDGGETFSHNDPLFHRFRQLVEAAMTQQPWLTLAYFQHLPSDDAAVIKARLSAMDYAGRLRTSSLAGLYDYRLKVASKLAMTIPGLPWELPLRHLIEHGTETPLRIDTALELGDWAWLQHAADTGSEELKVAAQAALDVAESLADVLRAGRLRRAEVRRGGVRVGQLMELEGATRFVYDREYLAQANARPIAPNMPLRPEPFDSPGLHPVFEGLLPQGWLLDIDLKKYRLKSGDQFGLLLATGRHTIGAIEVVPEDEAP